ncbi:hypothetical protein PG987_008495 [Apiospora arundinis]
MSQQGYYQQGPPPLKEDTPKVLILLLSSRYVDLELRVVTPATPTTFVWEGPMALFRRAIQAIINSVDDVQVDGRDLCKHTDMDGFY